MKRTTLALLLALTFAVGLVGCGRRNSADDNNMMGNNNPNSGSAYNGGAYDGNTNNGTMNGGTNSDTNNSTNGSTNNGTARSGNDGFMGSRSYDQMLRDGRVRDTDGDLTDGENSVSDW